MKVELCLAALRLTLFVANRDQNSFAHALPHPTSGVARVSDSDIGYGIHKSSHGVEHQLTTHRHSCLPPDLGDEWMWSNEVACSTARLMGMADPRRGWQRHTSVHA